MIATTENNSHQPLVSLREIQELAIAITAKSLNPAMLTVDFLKYSGIVPPDWELNGQPVLNPNYAQVNFQNGIGIVAQPRKITFVEMINSPDSLNLKLPEIVGLSAMSGEDSRFCRWDETKASIEQRTTATNKCLVSRAKSRMTSESAIVNGILAAYSEVCLLFFWGH